LPKLPSMAPQSITLALYTVTKTDYLRQQLLPESLFRGYKKSASLLGGIHHHTTRYKDKVAWLR
jgi:hypothetical protein